VASLRLFGPAREAAGVARAVVPGQNVAEVLGVAEERYGATFADIVAISRVWLNGESASRETLVTDEDEVAIIPPVSGG
jgi:molybdopterin converting factor small subunit